MRFLNIFGVDFSGAKLAGQNTWIAHVRRPRRRGDGPPFLLAELVRLEAVAGTAQRAEALAHLVERIGESNRALWALDFPFGLPIEILPPRSGWSKQFELLREWDHDGVTVHRKRAFVHCKKPEKSHSCSKIG